MWYLYILRCGDGSLYTGITTDVPRRLEAHRQGKGAKYTRGRAPLTLCHQEEGGTHSEAGAGGEGPDQSGKGGAHSVRPRSEMIFLRKSY